MKKVLLLASAVVMAAPALAEWDLTSQNDQQDWYIDHSTIRVTGEFRRVWALVNRKTPAPNGSVSAKILDEYDCKEGRSRTLQMTTYTKKMGQGDSRQVGGSPFEWEYIVPGTSGEALMKAVCRTY